MWKQALELLLNYDWPGNVRELENVLQAGIALAPDELITQEDLRLHTANTEVPTTDVTMSLEELEQRHIERVLQAVNGNRAAAARVLGIDRSTLYRKMGRIASSVAIRD